MNMRFLGNLIWLLIGGIIMALGWSLAGIVLCVTIIGIPFGLQCFKIAGFVLWPFGRDIELGNFGAGGLLLNVVWILIFGWGFFLAHLLTAAIFFVSIIGIPFGLQHFKLAKIGLMPFGARIHALL
jgi:uncharacterized membrane protein YccF (DUF307 family)